MAALELVREVEPERLNQPDMVSLVDVLFVTQLFALLVASDWPSVGVCGMVVLSVDFRRRSAQCCTMQLVMASF